MVDFLWFALVGGAIIGIVIVFANAKKSSAGVGVNPPPTTPRPPPPPGFALRKPVAPAIREVREGDIPKSTRRSSRRSTRAAQTRVRPTARRMRTGGTAYILQRDNFATDLLFLIALDAALGYDEIYYADAGYMDSPFMNDEFNYSGSDFEEYAEIDNSSYDEEPIYKTSEAEIFEDLSTDDDDTRNTGWDSGDNGDSGWDSDNGGGFDD